jgi:hypothetical protein
MNLVALSSLHWLKADQDIQMDTSSPLPYSTRSVDHHPSIAEALMKQTAWD